MKTIKKITAVLILITIVFANIACEEEELFYVDTTPPASPRNVQTYVGDNQVDITWNHNSETDLAGYNVYFAWEFDGRYELIGSTENDFYIDYEARNGEKYFYAVVAYDFNGNESELSDADVYGAPRPEGFDQAVFDYLKFPNSSGYIFSEYSIVAFGEADFFFENYDGTFYLNVWDDTDIQDMGETRNIYDIEFAPNSGWVPKYPEDYIKYVEAEVGHTYVIWTWANNYAKIRINRITNERMTFDWAYQTIEGEPQLKRSSRKGKRDSQPQRAIIKSR